VAQQDVPTDKANCLGYVFINETSFAAFTSIQNNPNPYETSRRLLTREHGTSFGSTNVYKLVNFWVVDDAGRPVDINGGHMMMDVFTYQRSSLYELARRSVTAFAEAAQEQRQVNQAQLSKLQNMASQSHTLLRADVDESTSI
jgi:hypothetical protein